MGIEAVCVTIAMYCLIQFYVQLRHDLKQHSPFLKILSIKLVILLSNPGTDHNFISHLVESHQTHQAIPNA
jgi:hypothetical protein